MCRSRYGGKKNIFNAKAIADQGLALIRLAAMVHKSKRPLLYALMSPASTGSANIVRRRNCR
jgi:hypothetical protein